MIFIIDRLDFHGDLLNLVETRIVHTLLKSVLPDEFFNMHTGFLEIHLEKVDFFSEIEDGILVDVTFDP